MSKVTIYNCTVDDLQVTLNSQPLKDGLVSAATYASDGTFTPGKDQVDRVGGEPREPVFGDVNTLSVQTEDGTDPTDYGTFDIPKNTAGAQLQLFLFYSMAILSSQGRAIWYGGHPARAKAHETV
jgi:hypothetical protein